MVNLLCNHIYIYIYIYIISKQSIIFPNIIQLQIQSWNESHRKNLMSLLDYIDKTYFFPPMGHGVSGYVCIFYKFEIVSNKK